MSLTQKSLFEIVQLLQAKKIKVLEVVEECTTIAEKNTHNAYISVLKELALEEAKRLDKESVSSSLLWGVPYTLKDLFITKGIQTTAASKTLFNYVPPTDGLIAKIMKECKAILIGKTNLDQFGMGSTGENSPFGPVLNPLAIGHVAGGSSSGSAASVKEGSAYFSFGTDTGGSIRLPAIFCGLNAYKPSYGLLSRSGHIAFASSLDQASVIAKTVLDLALVSEQVIQKDKLDTTNVDLGHQELVQKLIGLPSEFLRNKRVGIFHNWMNRLDPKIANALQSLIEHLKNEGIQFVDIHMPHVQYAVSVYMIIASSEASSNLARYSGVFYGHREKGQETLDQHYSKTRGIGFHREVKRRILLGTYFLSSGNFEKYFLKAAQVRRLIQQDLFRSFQNCDFILGPVSAQFPPKIGEMNESVKIYQNDFFNFPANLSGIPSIAISLKGDWPTTGFQLMAPQFQDKELFEFSYAVERSLS